MLKLLTVKVDHIDHVSTGAMARRERLSKGILLKAVADLMVLTEPYLSDLERGRRNWNPTLVGQYNNALKGIKT